MLFDNLSWQTVSFNPGILSFLLNLSLMLVRLCSPDFSCCAGNKNPPEVNRSSIKARIPGEGIAFLVVFAEDCQLYFLLYNALFFR